MSTGNLPASSSERTTRWFTSGLGEPSVKHVLVVIYLEFFSWALLTTPLITVLNETFPDRTLHTNLLINGIKGLLVFIGAPLIGALSDVWGRKLLLLLTVFGTCAPIPFILLTNKWWFFAMISASGFFGASLTIVFAYVADVVPGAHERTAAYGLVTATFAASFLISPPLGAYLDMLYGRETLVIVATTIAVLNIVFILVVVPEPSPQKLSKSAWKEADLMIGFRKVGHDKIILLLCAAVFLSYMPESGWFSSMFVYLRLSMGFKADEVAKFIAFISIKSAVVQVVFTRWFFIKNLGLRKSIIVGFLLEMIALAWLGFATQKWMIWIFGVLAALSSFTYPAISVFVSLHAKPDKQGLSLGVLAGVRGLCSALGPAMFSLIFYLSKGGLNEDEGDSPSLGDDIVPGPPFVFGSLMAMLAVIVVFCIPEYKPGQDSADCNSALMDMESSPQRQA